jgi:hypothetical protein
MPTSDLAHTPRQRRPHTAMLSDPSYRAVAVNSGASVLVLGPLPGAASAAAVGSRG